MLIPFLKNDPLKRLFYFNKDAGIMFDCRRQFNIILTNIIC